MKAIDTTRIDRRDFLRGATALAVAATLGVEMQTKAGAAESAQAHSALALGAPSGVIDPATLAAGSLGAATARVTIHGHFVPARAAAALRVVKAHYAIQANGQIVDTPVYVWAASRTKDKTSTFRIPIASAGGLLLSVEIGDPRIAEDFYFLSVGAAQGAPKLVNGTYALVAGSPNLTGCRIAENQDGQFLARATSTGLSQVDFEYLLVTILGV